ncbi:VOC family protein [Pseudooceanicola sp. LIPI14-2-Ac024]|uniref:VOC family protein n=1 Tax=Pseudooceanicola sp. LIPI14-2-Ac024 TaxID=3344875 RepID=UPI0035CFA93F
MTGIAVRYIVTDVDAAVAFYCDQLGFTVVMRPGPGFALLERGALRLMLNAPGTGGAGTTVADEVPAPGGWNRFQLQVQDLDAEVARLGAGGARLAGEIVEGKGGRQILVYDPSGNPVELFQPHPRDATARQS